MEITSSSPTFIGKLNQPENAGYLFESEHQSEMVSEANRTAHVLGGSFCINRAGKLEFRQYGKTPVMEILQKHRFSSCFSDFVTRYTAVSSTNLRTQTSEYYALETDDGLTMNLGVNPLLQFGGQARSC